MSFFDNFDLRQLNNLDLLARQVVEGFIIGLHKSPFHGFSVEFAEHRLYNQGESTKNIDWKVFARTDRLYTKKYEEETNLRCQIVLDISSSMNFPEVNAGSEARLNKLKFSSLAAASLMNLLQKQRDAFGLSLFDETLKIHTKAKSSTTHYRLLLTYLDQAINDTSHNRSTHASQALHQVADTIHKRSLVVVFTDMFDQEDDLEELFAAIQHLKYSKHEVILFQVIDKKLEMDFEFENRPYHFIDIETNQEIKLQSHMVKDYYLEKVAELQESIKQKCLQYRVDYEPIDIHKDIFKVLQAYLVKRSKMST
ncbi:MAG: DUF58 domain-containing protein [Saprospiraceae bacterium]|nr:DUF58 domain-containing protein [Saprospiraceae bacterium]